MTWTCTTCNRTFKRNKQAHSCEKHEVESLFIDKPANIWELYLNLISQIQEFGPMEIHIAKWNVTLRSATTFMTVIPENKHLTITFIRDEALDDFPVYDSYHYSKNRWSNLVKIESLDEIDRQLLSWLREAYLLCTEN